MEDMIRPRGKRERAVGVDLGVQNLLTLSSGVAIKPHPSLQRLRFNLRQWEYKAERQKIGSKRREETLRLIEKTKKEIFNCQLDYAQKIAAWLVKHYKTICVESVEESKNAHVIEANWPILSNAIQRACKKRNRTYVGVKPYFTSQVCSRCGALTKSPIEQRNYECTHCGLVIDRDVNAANVIKQTGLKILNKRR